MADAGAVHATGHVAPARALVRGAARARFAVVMAEAVVLAFGAACVTRAAASAEGVPSAGQCWTAALVAGALCAAAFAREALVGERALAGAIDRALRLEGALATAVEVEQAAVQGPIAALLSARVAARVNRLGALRAATPPVAPIAAATLVAVALLAWTEAAGARRQASHELLRGLAAALVRAGDAARAAGADARELEQLAAEARELAEATAGADAPPDALAGLGRRIDALLAAAPPAAAVASALRDAQEWAESARRALGGDAARGPGSASTAGAADRTGEAWREPETSALAFAPGLGTISPASMDAATRTESNPGEPGARAAEGAAPLERRWWSERHDGVVARWVERGRREPSPEEPR